MRTIGEVIAGIVATSAQKRQAAVNRLSEFGGETSSADPRAASELPDEPAMGEDVLCLLMKRQSSERAL